MKRLLFILYLLLILIAPTFAEKKVNDKLWIAVWSYDVPGERQFFDKLEEEFSKTYPVKIDLDKWDHAHDTMKQWLNDANGPDIMVVPDIWLAEFAEKLESLNDYFDNDFNNEFFEVLYKKGIYEDKLLGLVWATSTKALFYRTDLFETAGLKPPTTWKQQLIAAKKLNNPPEVYGLGLPGKPVYETDDNFFFYFWSAGGEFFDENFKCTINSPAGVKSLQFYVNLVNRYHVTQPEVTTWSRKECRRLFEDGRLAMFANGPWQIESLRKNAPDVNFAVVPLVKDKKTVTQIITDHIVIPAYSKQKQRAVEFLKFAYKDDLRLEFAKLGLLPEKKAVANNDYFQNDPAWKVFVDVIPYGKTIPLIQWEQIGAEIRQTMYDTISGRREVKPALDELAEKIDKIVSQQKTVIKNKQWIYY